VGVLSGIKYSYQSPYIEIADLTKPVVKANFDETDLAGYQLYMRRKMPHLLPYQIKLLVELSLGSTIPHYH
jgi:hypothetical protein